MLWRTALLSWLGALAGLTLAFAYRDRDRLLHLGLAITLLAPLIAVATVIRQRTPDAVFVFRFTLVAPALLGALIYRADARWSRGSGPGILVASSESSLGRQLEACDGHRESRTSRVGRPLRASER